VKLFLNEILIRVKRARVYRGPGINSIQAIKEAGGWRVRGIMVQAESATVPLPKEYLP
jgi:acid phosphatase class B